MKIKEMLTQHRRDFSAILVCERCECEQELSRGYDDAYYHASVIPKIQCHSCGETATSDYHPLTTKYPEGFVI